MTAIYDWPAALRPAAVDWPPPVVPQRMTRSTFDGSAQAQTIGAPRWEFTLQTGPMRLSEAPQWEALVQLLRGRVNRVRCWDWRRENPLTAYGGAFGTVTVAATATGNTAAVAGLPPSVPQVLKAGTRLGLGPQLVSVSVDVLSAGDGTATITFEPPLRAPVASGTVVKLVKPTAVFYLDTDRVGMPQQGARRPGTSMSFVEDVGLS